MPFMDRDSFIRLLDRLGDPDDSSALSAAREVHARMTQAGVGWSDLLIPAPATAPAISDPGAAGGPPEPDLRPVPPEEGETDAALIDRMLATYELSDATRLELLDLKGDIAAGEFTASDSRYLRDLEARLSRGR
ncbi:MAG TPA: hypothetical protein VED40_01985 [Azospirillaceae bacterium]|nr:hypothetical protein [Azospirillaceae bacterium]